MKTLDAKTLKAKKENLHAQFEEAKKNAVAYENAITKAGAKRDEWIEKMSQLQGAYKTIVELEKEIGVISPEKTLLDNNNEGGKKPGKK